MSVPADLRSRLEAAGQGHVLRHWETLTEAERGAFVRDLRSLDWDLVGRLSELAVKGLTPEAPSLAPPPVVREGDSPYPESVARAAARAFGKSLDSRSLDKGRARARFVEVGEKLMRSRRVAFVLVAGGQASRLGFDRPKGCFPIGPVSERCLFQVHADRLRAIARRTGNAPLWFVMTSPSNHAETVEFFDRQDYFGIPRERVVLFPQETVPAFDRQGKLLLESPGALFRNPNGHGGSLWALARSGFLDRCQDEGVEHLFYWQVDNPLVRIGDPYFLGLHHVVEEAGMSSKVVAKRGPEEKVGVLALGRAPASSLTRALCVEYSDLAPDLRDARGPDGELLYRAGNIAIHAFRVSFVQELTRGSLQLPWHRAEKKIRALGDDARPVEIPGVKFETFVFDALPLSAESVSLEVERQDEFAPVKNAEGEDSPRTSKDAIGAYFRRWFQKAGIPVVDGAGGPVPAEVNPQFAFDYREFVERRAELPRVLDRPLYLEG